MSILNANMTPSLFSDTLARCLIVAKHENFIDFLHVTVRYLGTTKSLRIMAEVMRRRREEEGVLKTVTAAELFVAVLREKCSRKEKITIFATGTGATPPSMNIEQCLTILNREAAQVCLPRRLLIPVLLLLL